MKDSAIQWLANGERGISSETMFEVCTGVKATDYRRGHPLDPDDFRRCLLLVERVDDVAAVFMERMPKVSEQWAALIKNWKKIEASFLAEAPKEWREDDCSWSAPKTYKLMESLLYPKRKAAQQ